jgi:hypothetical protein
MHMTTPACAILRGIRLVHLVGLMRERYDLAFPEEAF